MTEFRDVSGEQFEGETARSLSLLLHTTTRLNNLARLIVMETAIQIVILMVVILTKFSRYYNWSGFLSLMVGVQAAMFLSGALLAVMHESARKHGDSVFQELSNYLQDLPRPTTADSGIKMEARIKIRQFSAAADLPLFPGRMGPGIYVLLQLGLLIATIWAAFI